MLDLKREARQTTFGPKVEALWQRIEKNKKVSASERDVQQTGFRIASDT
jgi:hypothetical protein